MGRNKMIRHPLQELRGEEGGGLIIHGGHIIRTLRYCVKNYTLNQCYFPCTSVNKTDAKNVHSGHVVLFSDSG